jgi:multidrug efflux pump subunit AcrA (membrane-fusion protein)
VQLDFDDLHAIHAISADPMERQRFHVPKDLAIAGWLVTGALALAVAAAVLMHVDKIVPAKGVLETPLGVFTVRNMQSGYVQEIAIKAGEEVVPGQVLVRFDARMTELEIDKLQADKEVAARKAWSDSLMVRPQLTAVDRLLLEQRMAHVARPEALAGFERRLSHHTQRVQAVYSANQNTTATKLRDLTQQLGLQQQSLRLQQQELAKAADLVKEGFESEASLLGKRRAYVDMQAKEQALLAEMGGLKGEMARLGHDESRQLGDLALEQLRRIDTALELIRK